jgi:hypothetical protein
VVSARTAIEKRKFEIDVDQQRGRVTEAMSAVTKGGPLGADTSGFEAKIADLDKAIEAGEPFAGKDSRYAHVAAEARKASATAKKKVEAKKLELAVAERKKAIEDALVPVKAGAENCRHPDATPAMITDAENAVKNAREEVGKGAAYESKDKRYADLVARTKKALDKFQHDISEAKDGAAFREKVLGAATSAVVSLDALNGSPEERKKSLTTALDSFKSCQKEGASILADHPKLVSTLFPIGKKKLKASAVVVFCSEQAKNTETKLGSVNATLAFYDGPAKALEKAKQLMEQAEAAKEPEAKNKVFNEALSQFEACLESGRMLEFKHPELKKSAFDFAGGKVTLTVVVAACQKGAKDLRASIKRI